MENIKKVNYDELTAEPEDKAYLANISGDYPNVYRLNGQLYTGIVYENFKGGYYEFNVVNGIENGTFFSLYPNGQKKDEGINKDGYEIENI